MDTCCRPAILDRMREADVYVPGLAGKHPYADARHGEDDVVVRDNGYVQAHE